MNILRFLFFVFIFSFNQLKASDLFFVTLGPLYSPLVSICQTDCSVDVVLGPVTSHEAMDITPSMLAKLSKAKVLFVLGAHFEDRLIKKIQKSLPQLDIVVLGKDQINKVKDDHLWVSPIKMKNIVKKIGNKLVSIYPEKKEILNHRLNDFIAKIDEKHLKIESFTAQTQNLKILTLHKALGHLEEDYKIVEFSLEKHDHHITLKNVIAIKEDVKKHKFSHLIVPSDFSFKKAEEFAKILDVKIMTIDLLNRDLLLFYDNLLEIMKKGDK